MTTQARTASAELRGRPSILQAPWAVAVALTLWAPLAFALWIGSMAALTAAIAKFTEDADDEA